MAKAKTPSAPLRTRLRYRFDNALARGPIVVIAYLGLLSAIVVLVAAVVATLSRITFGGGLDGSFGEALWQSLLRTLDAGTFAADGPWPTRALGVVVTLLGIFLAGSLIGLIANAVDQRVEELRRGRGAVVEHGHTLILGWSDQVSRIVGELVIANESERDAAVVVLATAEKTEMDDHLRAGVPDRKTTRVVTRQGDPSVPADLERASIAGAKAIVIVAGEGGDAGVVSAVLAVRALDPKLERCHIVAEIDDPDIARTLRTVTAGRVLTVSRDRVVAEVTAQASVQSGLAAVFSDLLDFDGDEIYFAPIPEVVGRTYAEAQLALEASSVIGRVKAAGELELNPPPSTLIEAGDRLVLVAADDSAVAFSGFRHVVLDEGFVAPEVSAFRDPVRVLLVGWSSFGAVVLEQLDEFLVAGSTIIVQLDPDLADPSLLDGITLASATLEVRTAANGPEDLLALADEQHIDQVIVLAYRDGLSASDADARTLLTLLTLRMIWPAGASSEVRILAELTDQRNVDIAQPVGIDDLIVSDAMASLLMAQLAEHPGLLAVFDDLFDADGAVVSLVPVPALVRPGPMCFADLVAAASAQGMSAFGYRLAAGNQVVMNPTKSASFTLGRRDQVVVIETRAAPEAPPRRWFED